MQKGWIYKMRILHAADFHLDAPLAGFTPDATTRLRREMLTIPGKISEICMKERCELILLSGDLFDGPATVESVRALYRALEETSVPTFISPGNHDFCAPGSPWLTEMWPSNVHVFTKSVVESVAMPELDCRVYGAAFTGMDCGPLLEGFAVEGQETYHIGVFHGDPTQRNSNYNPITQIQVADSGLDYLALGHIHKTGSFTAGKTLCAWPGCPMGHGYDETEEKGVLLVELDGWASARFLPLTTTRFFDLEAAVRTTAEEALASVLPGAGSEDFYRITLTGECEKPDLTALKKHFSSCPNLELRDSTVPVADVWSAVGEDSLEGVYFRMLRDAMDGQDEQSRRIALLAARISRKILDGQEVVLP